MHRHFVSFIFRYIDKVISSQQCIVRLHPETIDFTLCFFYNILTQTLLSNHISRHMTVRLSHPSMSGNKMPANTCKYIIDSQILSTRLGITFYVLLPSFTSPSPSPPPYLLPLPLSITASPPSSDGGAGIILSGRDCWLTFGYKRTVPFRNHSALFPY